MVLETVSVASRKQGAVLVRFFKKGEPFPGELLPGEFKGEANSAAFFSTPEGRSLAIGLGDGIQIEADTYRQAAGTAVRVLQQAGVTRMIVDLRGAEKWAREIAVGILMGGYYFDTFLPDDRKLKSRVQQVQLLVAKPKMPAVAELVHAGQIIGEAVNFTRSLGDLPGNYIYPEALAETALSLGVEFPALKVKVLEEQTLQKGGFGGMTAVGGGSAHPPRLIEVLYQGGRKGEAPLALVGKAITFDSGGISIKPGDRMDEMKYDKMGGCAVLGIMRAIAALKLKINVVGLIPAAENMLDSQAYRPGDIVTTYDGKTIEVLNTDAEGRVVLADALAYARIVHRPHRIVDFATLTGAVIVALGTYKAGLFTSGSELEYLFRKAGDATGEKVWPLPYDEPYRTQIRSDVACVKNTGGREGGACTAAAFLSQWVGELPWVHLDIAGTAWTTRDLPYLAKGASGFGVRLLLETLLS